MNPLESKTLLDLIIACYYRALEAPVENLALQVLPGVQEAARYRDFLHYFIQERKTQCNVELGTDNGTTACYMGAACQEEQQVITLDIGFRADAAQRIAQWLRVKYCPKVSSLTAHANFTPQSIGLLYMDTDHTFKTTSEERKLYLPKMALDSIMCVDDIMLHKQMRRFWQSVTEPKFVLNRLHTQHLNKTAEDGTFLPEGTGWGIIIPHGTFPDLSLPHHPIIGGYVIT